MLTVNQALQKASDTSRWAVGMCDNFVANMFGYTSSGYPTAQNHWNSIPAQDKHPGDSNAPAGALMFWGGGAGHVAISDGHGGIFSTDMPTPGVVGHVSASTISSMWGKPYLGWTIPIFQGQAGSVASDASYNIPVPGLGSVPIPGIPNPSDVGKGLLDGVAGIFGINVLDMMERAALMFIGAVLLFIGLIRVSGGEGFVKNKVNTQVEANKANNEKVEKEIADRIAKQKKASEQAAKRRTVKKRIPQNG
jgi:hypothetical protein